MNIKARAIAFIVLNCTAFTLSMTINKLVNPAIPVAFKVLIRAIFGFMLFSPIILQQGWKIFVSNKLSLHLKRILLMTLAMGSTYFAYTKLPFTIAISIGFTGPIFTAVLAYFILKDRLKLGQWIAIFVGYVGVWLIVKPQGEVNKAVYVALLANIAASLSVICIKKLTRIDSGRTILILGNVGIICTTALWSLLHWLGSMYANTWMHVTWIWPTWQDFRLLIVMGFLGAIAQLAHIQALKYASPSFLASFEYCRLVIAIPISLALGEALPSYREIIGIFIILLATFYHSWQGNYQSGNKS